MSTSVLFLQLDMLTVRSYRTSNYVSVVRGRQIWRIRSADDLKAMHRGLGAYLSVRDQIQLFVKSIETENIEDENGIPFQIFYGISDNTHKFWSIANARKVIGYAPEDNSQLRFADRLTELLKEAEVP